jgi:hypothetical protein
MPLDNHVRALAISLAHRLRVEFALTHRSALVRCLLTHLAGEPPLDRTADQRE